MAFARLPTTTPIGTTILVDGVKATYLGHTHSGLFVFRWIDRQTNKSLCAINCDRNIRDAIKSLGFDIHDFAYYDNRSAKVIEVVADKPKTSKALTGVMVVGALFGAALSTMLKSNETARVDQPLDDETEEHSEEEREMTV